MNSVNSIARAFGLIAVYHWEFLSESSQKPDLTKPSYFVSCFYETWFRAMQSVAEGSQSCHRGLRALYQYPTLHPWEQGDLLTSCLWEVPAALVACLFPEVGIADEQRICCYALVWSITLMCWILPKEGSSGDTVTSFFFLFCVYCLWKYNQLYWRLGTTFIS